MVFGLNSVESGDILLVISLLERVKSIFQNDTGILIENLGRTKQLLDKFTQEVNTRASGLPRGDFLTQELKKMVKEADETSVKMGAMVRSVDNFGYVLEKKLIEVEKKRREQLKQSLDKPDLTQRGLIARNVDRLNRR